MCDDLLRKGELILKAAKEDLEYDLPMRAPFATFGGLTRFAKNLLPLFPNSGYLKYIELFCGSGEMIWCHPPRASLEVMNDLDPVIIRLHRIIKGLTKADIETLEGKDWIARKAHYEKLMGAPEPDEDLEFLYRQVYLRRFAREGMAKPRFRRQSEGDSYHRIVQRLAKCSLMVKNVKVTRLDYKAAVKQFDGKDSFFFIDMPYPELDMYYPFPCPDIEEQRGVYAALKGKALIVLLGPGIQEMRQMGWHENRFKWPIAWGSQFKMGVAFTNYKVRKVDWPEDLNS